MDTVCTNGPTAVFTKETGIRIRYLVMESIFGMTAELTKDIGLKITCMVKESTCGPTAESTKVNTSTTRSMAMEFIPIRMDDRTKDNGLPESSTVKEYS
jgi:hypothetical protein